eukprot:1162078-Pelagomonas_calceolata.AAC.8
MMGCLHLERVGSHREKGGPCWDVGWYAYGLGVGLGLAVQGLLNNHGICLLWGPTCWSSASV